MLPHLESIRLQDKVIQGPEGRDLNLVHFHAFFLLLTKWRL